MTALVELAITRETMLGSTPNCGQARRDACTRNCSPAGTDIVAMRPPDSAVASVALFDARGSTRRRSTHNGGTATFRGSSRCFVMGMIEFEESAIQVDATIVGEGLGIEPSLLQAHMREGKVTSMCERGVDEDIGRHRLTFFYGSRRFRLIIDEAGNVVQRSLINFSDHPLAASARKRSA